MRPFIKKIILFIILNFICFVLIFETARYLQVKSKTSRSFIGSNIIDYKPKLLFLGTSRARAFNESEVDSILKKKTKTLYKPGSSITTELILLKTLLDRGLKVDEIVLFLDFFQFYGEQFCINARPFEREPISYELLSNLLLNEPNVRLIKDYIYLKFFPEKPPNKPPQDNPFEQKKIIARTAMTYDYGNYKEKYFNKQMTDLESLIKLVKKNKITLSIINLPILDKKQPKAKHTMSQVVSLCNKLSVSFFDYSTLNLDSSHFMDGDHLNKKGAIAIVREHWLNHKM